MWMVLMPDVEQDTQQCSLRWLTACNFLVIVLDCT